MAKKKKEKKYQGLSGKAISRRILKKPKQLVVRIKQSEPAEYTSTFFKNEWNEARKFI
ncbi:MAG TPA: hypothetical protein VMZ91_04250 [Candidatus Paceibacterota bacterium]|nr:hypothetical protein [Candidatus Paceibacterota bacterium]